MASAVRRPPSSLMSPTITRAPAATSWRAVSAPIPVAPPATTITLCSSSVTPAPSRPDGDYTEALFALGPNGSGKSTTMRMIMALDNPTSGTTLVNGKPYADLAWPLREVGALLDAKAYHPARSAYDHLLFLARSNDIARSRIDEVLDIVGLTEVAHQRAGKYSLGMGQRLGIATALLGDPGVLLFDEPINGLDPEGIRWARFLLRDLAAEG